MKSILEWPILALHLIPFVKDYHGGSTREPGTYEHVWGGFIYCVFFTMLGAITPWMLIGIPTSFFYHVLIIECILDRKKNKSKPEKLRSRDFWAQIIERCTGYAIYFIGWGWLIYFLIPNG